MMDLALKLISTLAKSGKSFKVLSMAFDEISGEILLADTATGAEFTLELKPARKGYPDILSVRDEAYAMAEAPPVPPPPEPPPPVPPPPEPPPPEPPPPTIMAKKGPVDFSPTFKMIRAAREWPSLTNEARILIGELERAELKIGDDVALIAAAKKAGTGDVTALRQLAEQRRPPATRAAAPPPQN